MSTAVFPSQNAWITPRTIEGKITDSNCELFLSQKIDSVQKILLNTANISVRINAGDGSVDTSLDVLRLSNGEKLSTLDITKYVVEKSKYETLPIKGLKIITSDKKGLFKDNAWYYEHNSQNITLINKNFGAAVFVDPVFYNIIAGAVLSMGNNVMMPNGYPVVDIEMPPKPSSIMAAKFRVYYTPLGESVKLQVPKTNPQANEFCIPYSQQQQIVDNITLGREMQSIANRAGCETKEVVRTLRSFADVRHPNDGWYYNEKDANGNLTGDVWRLTGNHMEIYSEKLIRTVETWSKNWSYQSPNVPIDREFRSWNIPADIVQRNLLWQDYCLISTKSNLKLPQDQDAILSPKARRQIVYAVVDMDGIDLMKQECSVMWLYTQDGNNKKGVVLSCSAFGFGNSLVFSGKTKDNLSAGVQRVKSDSKDENYQFCRDVYYCDEDGTLPKMRVQVGGAIASNNTEAYYAYPEYSDDGNTELNGIPDDNLLFNDVVEFTVLKDPCEQLNFTYQLHLLTDNPYLVIGTAWAANNPLVKSVGEAGRTKTKVWYLTRKLPAGAQVMTSTYGVEETDTSKKAQLVTIVNDADGISFSSTAGETIDGKPVVGICVTDENNNVLVAYNNTSYGAFNVYFTHDYKAIAQALKK